MSREKYLGLGAYIQNSHESLYSQTRGRDRLLKVSWRLHILSVKPDLQVPVNVGVRNKGGPHYHGHSVAYKKNNGVIIKPPCGIQALCQNPIEIDPK